MISARFLVSMREVNNQAMINIIKEDICFWKETVYADDSTDDVIMTRQTSLDELLTKTCDFN